MRKKIAAVLCAAAAFLTMSGCKKAPPGTLTGISISYSGMCYDDTYGFSIRNDPADGCLFSCNYKEDEWVELENIPVEDTHWQEALALAEKLGLDCLVSPKDITSDVVVRYARALRNSQNSNMETMYKIMDGKAEALEFKVCGSSAITQTALKDLALKPNTLIAGIIRGRKTIIPTGEDKIMPGDKVVVLAANRRLHDLTDIIK